MRAGKFSTCFVRGDGRVVNLSLYEVMWRYMGEIFAMGENFLFGFESIPYEFLRILYQLKIHRGTVCYTSSYTALDLFFY